MSADIRTYEQRLAQRCRRLATDHNRALDAGHSALAERIEKMYARAVEQLGYDPLAEFSQPAQRLAAEYDLPEPTARRAVQVVETGMREGHSTYGMWSELERDPVIASRSICGTDNFLNRIIKHLGYELPTYP